MIFNSVNDFIQAVIDGRNEIDIQDYIDETFKKGGLARLEQLHLVLLVEYATNDCIVNQKENAQTFILKALDLIEESIIKFKNENLISDKSEINLAKYLTYLSCNCSDDNNYKYFDTHIVICFNKSRLSDLFNLIYYKIEAYFKFNPYGEKNLSAKIELIKHYMSCAFLIDKFLCLNFNFEGALNHKKQLGFGDILSLLGSFSDNNNYTELSNIKTINNILDILYKYSQVLALFELEYFSPSEGKKDIILHSKVSDCMDTIFQTNSALGCIIENSQPNKIIYGVEFDIDAFTLKPGDAAKYLYEYIDANDALFLATEINRNIKLLYFYKVLDTDLIKSRFEIYSQFWDAYIWLGKILDWYEEKNSMLTKEANNNNQNMKDNTVISTNNIETHKKFTNTEFDRFIKEQIKDDTLYLELKEFVKECCDNYCLNDLINRIFSKFMSKFDYEENGDNYICRNYNYIHSLFGLAYLIDSSFTEDNNYVKVLQDQDIILFQDIKYIFSSIPEFCIDKTVYDEAIEKRNLVFKYFIKYIQQIARFEKSMQLVNTPVSIPNNEFNAYLEDLAFDGKKELTETYYCLKLIVDNGDIHKAYTDKDFDNNKICLDIGVRLKNTHHYIVTVHKDLLLAIFIQENINPVYFLKALDFDYIKSNPELMNQLKVAYFWLGEIIKWYETEVNGITTDELNVFVNQKINEHLQAETPITISQNPQSIESNNNSPTNITNDSPNHQMSTKEFFDQIDKDIFGDVKLKTILDDAVRKRFIGKEGDRYIWASDKYLIVKKVDFGRFIHEAFSKCCKEGYTINGNFPENLINNYFNISSIGATINQASSNIPKRYEIVKQFLDNH